MIDLKDPNAGTAFELARQMMSPHLEARNPKFKCEFNYVDNEPPTIKAEYMDGSIWTKVLTPEYKLNEIRADLFAKASDLDDDNDDDDNDDDKGKSKGKGGKK